MSQKRKLVAILSADVVEYSRLMGADEQSTITTLTAYREVFSRHIESYSGRVVDATGDALLAEFGSAIEAVKCAADIQEELGGRNSELREERRMQFRIGVNVGDVAERDGALFGDGVNIAARLEALASPGGVCVSGTVFDQVDGKLPFVFKFGGNRTVKNIAKPVRAYFVELGTEANRHKPSRFRFGRPRRLPQFVAIALIWTVLLVISYFGKEWFNSTEHDVFAMPTGPTVAVLPFTNMDGISKQDYFADGLTEDIITELSRVRELRVLARNTTFQFKGKSVDVRAVGRELGADYVLEGSVRTDGSQVRVTAQLIDVSDGAHLWAEKYNRELEEIFTVQDEITEQIVGAVPSPLQQSTRTRVASKRPENLQAWELVVRANTPPDFSQRWYDDKLLMLEEAISIEPNYARALHEYAWHKLFGWVFRFEGSVRPPEEIRKNAIRAVNLDPNDAYAHRTAAFGYLFDGQLEFFRKEAKAALELAPYNADVFAQMGMVTVFTGDWERGRNLIEKAYKLDPSATGGWYQSAMHYYHFHAGDYRAALEVVRAHPGQAWCETQWKYVAAYGQLGQPEYAKEHWESCVDSIPGFSADLLAEMQRIWGFRDPFLAEYMDAIRKAGYPCSSIDCKSR